MSSSTTHSDDAPDWEQVRALFDLIADSDRAEQRKILDERCVDNPVLRKLVEELLGADEARPEPFLESADLQSCFQSSGSLEDAGLRPGGQFAGYEIQSLIAEGGMGAVFLARQESLARDVALKVMKPGFMTEMILKRFDLEVRVLARLQHKGIARIHEAGVHNQVPYFVMELVRGEPVTKFAAGKSQKDQIEMLIHISDAVEYAHQRGVIHRDLKPANILVDEFGEPRILDFGVARATGKDVERTTLVTSPGQIVGTIPYMSPEQAGGDPDELDTRADVYALGVILFEVLGGCRPLDMEGKPITEALRILRDVDPPLLGTILPELRGDLETIAAKALEKDPDRRYASAGEFSADLRRTLSNEPIAARPATTLYQLVKFARRHRGLVAGLVATFLVLALGIVVSLKLYVDAEDARALEADARKKAEGSLDAETATVVFLGNILGSVSPQEAKGEDVLVLEVLGQAAARVGSEFPNQPHVEANLRRTIALTYKNLGRPEDAKRQIDAALLLIDRFRETHPLLAGRVLEAQGVLLSHAEKPTESQAALSQAIAIYESIPGPPSSSLISAINNVGVNLKGMKDYESAEVAFLRARELSEQTSDSRELARALSGLSETMFHRDRLQESDQYKQESVRILVELYGLDHPLVAETRLTHVQVLQGLGRNDDAESELREVARITRKIFPDGHPSIARPLVRLSEFLSAKGDLEGAEAALVEGIENLKTARGKNDASVARGLNDLAGLYWRMSRLDLAENAIAESLVIHRDHDPESSSVSSGLANLALLQYSQKKYELSEQTVREALDLQIRLFGKDHGGLIQCYEILTELALVDDERTDEAVGHARNTVRIADLALAEANFQRFTVRTTLARSLKKAGEYEECETVLLVAHDGLARTRRKGDPMIRGAAEDLAMLYDAMERPSDAKVWRQKASSN